MMRRMKMLCAVLLASSATLGVAPVLAGGDHGNGDAGHGQSESGGQHGDGGEHHSNDGHHGSDEGHGFAFGEAAPKAEPGRTIELTARDQMRFEPKRITVEAGETVRFVVRNEGELQHSFTLGSPKYHRKHDKAMSDMPRNKMAGHMADSPNGTVIPPGETARITWRFEQGGPVMFACHIPGHYDAGMKGRIQVEAQ